MFLNRLTLEEKNAFLLLAHHIAHIDENFCDKEKVMINKYCMEMQMDDVEFDAASFYLEDTLSVFQDNNHKKIALLEIMALVYSDGDLHKAEEAVLNKMVEEFELNPNLAIVYKEWAKSILSLFIQGEALIHL
jgi:uncharacterized tellurite resistance protein B-like protein